MVIAKSETAYSRLKNAFRHREVDKTYHALVQGHPDPLEGTIDAPIGRHTKSDWKFAVHEDGKHSVTHYDDARGAPLRQPARGAPRDRPHPPDPGAHGGAEAPVRRRPHLRRRPTLAQRVGLERQWLHAVRLGFVHPGKGEYVEYESTYPADLAHALEVIRDAD